jgi:hypothetical protein
VVQVRSWAGLDVHAAKVVAAAVDGESGELSVRRLGGDVDAVAAFLAGFPGPVGATYEAGPTGFGWRVRLSAWAWAVWSRRRGKFRWRRPIASRPIGAMQRSWSGC